MCCRLQPGCGSEGVGLASHCPWRRPQSGSCWRSRAAGIIPIAWSAGRACMARFSSAGVLTRRATQGGEDQGKGFIDPSSALSEFCFQKVVSMKTLSTLLVLTVTFSPRRFAAPSPPVNDHGRARKASRDPGNDELRRLDGDRNGFQRQRHGAVCRCAGARCRAPLLSRGAIANSALNRNDAVGADEAAACSCPPQPAAGNSTASHRLDPCSHPRLLIEVP